MLMMMAPPSQRGVTAGAAAPTVTSLSPDTGDPDGGTAFTLTGTNFVSGATITIGGASATGVGFTNSTTLTGTSPSGTAGARDVVVTNPDTQSGTLVGGFTFTASGTEPLFHSDFSGDPTATASGYASTPGYGLNAVTDNGKWTRQWWYDNGSGPGSSRNGRIVTASGEGIASWPAGLTYALKCSMGDNADQAGCDGDIRTGGFTAPAVGETLYQRYYFANCLRDSVEGGPGGGNHPFSGLPGSCTNNWAYKWGSRNDSTFPFLLGFFVGNSGRAYADASGYLQWQVSGLAKFTALRIEAAYTKTATDTYDVRLRIDGSDPGATGGVGDAYTLAANPEATISDSCLLDLFMGNSSPGDTFAGGSTGADPDDDFYYWGAVAIRVSASADDWIGAYDSGRGW